MVAPTDPFTLIPLADVDPDSPVTTDLMNGIRLNQRFLWSSLFGEPVGGTPGGFDIEPFDPARGHNHDGFNSRTVSGASTALQLIQRIEPTSTVTTVTFSGLNGDTDQLWLLTGHLVMGASTVVVKLRPNGISTSQGARRSIAATTETFLLLADSGGLGSAQLTFQTYIYADTTVQSVSLNRVFPTSYVAHNQSLADLVDNFWTDTSTVITSLDIRAEKAFGVAGDILPGSFLSLYRVRQS